MCNIGDKEEIIVVGAGIAGLSAAIVLQHSGYQVTIYEQNIQPGGKMARIEKDGFTFDVGPTIVMMPEVFEEVFQMVGRDPADYVDIQALDPLYDVYFSPGSTDSSRHYSIPSRLQDMMALVESRGRDSAQGFLHYLADIYDRYQIAKDDFIRRPFRHKRDFYNPYMIKQALKLKTFDSAANMLADYIPDSDLRDMLAFQTLYIGISPKKGPSLYSMIPMIELLYGVHFIKGGMHEMAQAMTKLLTELGGTIHYGQKVSEIVTDDDKVTGIIANDQFIAGDCVISNVDFPTTMTHLIKDPKARGKYTPEKINKMDYSCSCLIFYWGIKAEDLPLEVHNFIISDDLDTNITEIFSGQRLKDPSIYLHIPSLADSSLAPQGHHAFYTLIPVPALDVAEDDYRQSATLAYYRDKALQALSALPGLENIASQIVSETIMTPNDFKEQFGAYYGATFGLQPTLLQSNHFRPQAKSLACQGLYFTGSSTHPGAGVPIVIESGRICAKEVMRDLE